MHIYSKDENYDDGGGEDDHRHVDDHFYRSALRVTIMMMITFMGKRGLLCITVMNMIIFIDYEEGESYHCTEMYV